VYSIGKIQKIRASFRGHFHYFPNFPHGGVGGDRISDYTPKFVLDPQRAGSIPNGWLHIAVIATFTNLGD